MSETPSEHPVEYQFPAVTAEDLCYSYEIEGSTCQINEQGNIIVDGQTSGIENDRYYGVIETKLAQAITGRMLTEEAETSYLRENTQRMPFSQIRNFILQGLSLVVIGQAPYITSPIKNFRKSKELQIYDLLGPVLRKAVAKGRFTQLHTAAMAKRLGYERAVPLILRSVKDPAPRVLKMLETCKALIFSDLALAADLARILRQCQEPELRTYLDTKKLAMASFDKGLSLEKIGRTEEAIQAYLEAVKLDPQGKYYSFLGSAFKKIGKLEEAVKAYQKAAKAVPSDYFYQLQLADALEETGKAKAREAITAYRSVIAGYGQIIRTKRPPYIPEPEWRYFIEILRNRIRTISDL